MTSVLLGLVKIVGEGAETTMTKGALAAMTKTPAVRVVLQEKHTLVGASLAIIPEAPLLTTVGKIELGLARVLVLAEVFVIATALLLAVDVVVAAPAALREATAGCQAVVVNARTVATRMTGPTIRDRGGMTGGMTDGMIGTTANVITIVTTETETVELGYRSQIATCLAGSLLKTTVTGSVEKNVTGAGTASEGDVTVVARRAVVVIKVAAGAALDVVRRDGTSKPASRLVEAIRQFNIHVTEQMVWWGGGLVEVPSPRGTCTRLGVWLDNE